MKASWIYICLIVLISICSASAQSVQPSTRAPDPCSHKPIADVSGARCGWAYERGDGRPQDYAIAFKLYQSAADQGDPIGADLLGRLYRDGHGTKQDSAEAAKWFRQAADQLSNDGKADLGNLYAVGGANFPQNYEEAYFWLSMPRWPHDGDIKGWPPDGRIRNTVYDFDTPCIYESFDKAVKHLTDEQRASVDKRVAEWKPPPSRADDLGNCRYNGNGAERNKNDVKDWCIKAAEKGYEPAEENLGEFYNWGRFGLETDYKNAYFWWSIALKNMSAEKSRLGGKAAVESFRDEAAKRLTSEQRTAANKRISEWKPKTK
jgi:TPR repeat protein